MVFFPLISFLFCFLINCNSTDLGYLNKIFLIKNSFWILQQSDILQGMSINPWYIRGTPYTVGNSSVNPSNVLTPHAVYSYRIIGLKLTRHQVQFLLSGISKVPCIPSS